MLSLKALAVAYRLSMMYRTASRSERATGLDVPAMMEEVARLTGGAPYLMRRRNYPLKWPNKAFASWRSAVSTPSVNP